jgi:hypothetical protein
MKYVCICVAGITALNGPASAQQVSAPIQAIAPAPTPQVSLPANTEVLLSMNEELTTKGGRVEVGTKFRLTVVNDVRIGQYIVIPRGTPAVGEVTWKTGRGAFGKSGKMEIELRYIDLNGRMIPVSGHYRQEGEGNTVATAAVVIGLSIIGGGLITGHSAVIPEGRELKAYTTEALPVTLPPGASLAPAPVVAQSPTPATPVQATSANPK